MITSLTAHEYNGNQSESALQQPDQLDVALNVHKVNNLQTGTHL